MTTDPSPPRYSGPWPDYRTVWRWHFYAGIFCIPFVVILSLSGAVYLFKTEIEAWEERAYDNLQCSGPSATVSEQVRAALRAFPKSNFTSYELPQSPTSAARVVTRNGDESSCIFVHPQTMEILGTMSENQRLMRWIFRLHGELLMGDLGSHIVETAASWTIIMIFTGLYLWWPRKWTGLAGVVYPRLNQGGKVFWRDLHSVTGIWISFFALFLLFSGLPWSKFWGNYLKTVRRLTGTAVAQQDWSNGSERAGANRGGRSSGEHSGHSERMPLNSATANTPIDVAPLDRIVATVGPLNLPPPVVISPPRRGSKDWTAKSMTPNRPKRVNLTLDEAGTIKERENFADRHVIDRIVSVGIAAHEGRLFGVANQVLGLVTAAGLVAISVSGVILWWRRRTPGTLGAPAASVNWRPSLAFIALVVVLSILLPLFGGTLLAVLALERLLLARLPLVRDWLGLQVRCELPAVEST